MLGRVWESEERQTETERNVVFSYPEKLLRKESYIDKPHGKERGQKIDLRRLQSLKGIYCRRARIFPLFFSFYVCPYSMLKFLVQESNKSYRCSLCQSLRQGLILNSLSKVHYVGRTLEAKVLEKIFSVNSSIGSHFGKIWLHQA